MTSNLFDALSKEMNWTPLPPPSLSGISQLEFDCETDGLKWWEKDRPIGCSITLPQGVLPEGNTALYLPWGHQGGGNLDEAVVKRWAKRELRNKHLTGLNIRFDIHQFREWGVDLEAQGCTFSDVGHYAALLDDHRKRLNLDSLVQDYLGIEKVGKELDATRMASYHAGEVAPRAEADVWQVRDLRAKMWPLLDEQELQRVRQLEDEIIPVVCEMEKNGTLIDQELLEKWIHDTEQDFERCLWKIHRETGLAIDPGRTSDKEKLFNRYHLRIERTPNGTPSFTDAILKALNHPVIETLRRAIKLKSLRSKYLLKYRDAVDSHGVLRYSLHQLRVEKDDTGQAGTISGRFSSSAITRGVGVNIQQVMKVSKQMDSLGDKYLIRQLHVPESGLWLSADAMQIEYRMFASYAGTPSVLKAYEKDPLLSFHKLIWEMIKPFKPDITYRQQKDLNFAKIYAAGIVKLARMLEFISEGEAEELRRTRASRGHPKLQQAVEVEGIYARELPEVAPLLRKASNLASERGYVKTLLGRRMRFPHGHRLHKALNGIIQGGAADVNKKKLVELHQERKQTGFKMRFTVHDEVDGDIPDMESASQVSQILDRQSFSTLRVPILWDVSTGKNWRECS
jgi:DNA polymerase-1|tara:strand:- start:2691 stop:4562 length:1872 start_codon:yes stop_codon:yes gene_type:complete